ncbi:MBL fold metallo-hydrolase [Microvirga puerhi]|uniref:MBL fold metallo-hydrolase n=1 Tax=Microvirga puerhi TaxID=2876078 RepID=A0ABS7VSD3_9HYPH|nr:MBL fold metallo-hydrolase [Microvirga puerhi]MBZ6078025.1 MBL fold metallo-hydrolase [Microvirga puerhi]
MDITADEIAADVFRVSYYAPELDFTFNQYLVRDDEPLLYHTGFRRTFRKTRDAIARLIDPAKVRWIAYSHFEPDECGALNEWLTAAPESSVIAGPVGGGVVLDDFADRPATILEDNETLSTGRRRFKFLCTPHVPHGWDASLLFEETEGTLFCSDLFLHNGRQSPIVECDIVEPARDQIVCSSAGPFAHSLPYTTRTDAVFQRLARLNPRTLAVMHGAAFRGDGARALTDLGSVMADLARGGVL